MRIGWGWKIAGLYGGFVAMIICLIVASSHQNIDLVTQDYYKDEIGYQAVLDASRNQAQLTGEFAIHANDNAVIIEFPAEFGTKAVSGNVLFYSAANKDWDKAVRIEGGDAMTVPRSQLHATMYEVKISYSVDGRDYYYQTRIDLSAS